MLADRRRRPPLGLALATIGLGVALWFGYDWYRAPTMSADQITQLVDLNLAADVARRPDGAQPTPEQLATLSQSLREEITAELTRTRNDARMGCLAGLAAAVFGFLQMFLLRRAG
jgi:hypothetical protein